MTNYITQQALGTHISPFVSKDKGDIQNRISCSVAQTKNNLKTAAQDVVVIGGTVAGMAAVAKSKSAQNVIAKGVGVAAKAFKPVVKMLKTTKFGNAMKDIATKIKGLSPRAKGAAAVVGLLGACILGHINRNNAYKAGQIDQKYTDRAALRKHQDAVLN